MWKKVNDTRPIIIRDKETKEEIYRTCAINLAEDIIENFEEEDRKNKCFKENSYEIFNIRTNEIIK